MNDNEKIVAIYLLIKANLLEMQKEWKIQMSYPL